MNRQTGEELPVVANANRTGPISFFFFFPIGPQNTRPLGTIVPPVCLLADTSNNPHIWLPSKLIATLDGIDPCTGGFPLQSRVLPLCASTELHLAPCDSFLPLLLTWLLKRHRLRCNALFWSPTRHRSSHVRSRSPPSVPFCAPFIDVRVVEPWPARSQWN